MKRKVCVRSMVLGAVIMLVGLAVGAIVSPPLIAQRNGVFGDIECTGLTVVNKSGKLAVALDTDDANRVLVYDNREKLAIALASDERGNRVDAFDKQGELAVILNADGESNRVGVHSSNGKGGVMMDADEQSRGIVILDNQEKMAVLLHNDEERLGNGIAVFDKNGNLWWGEKTD